MTQKNDGLDHLREKSAAILTVCVTDRRRVIASLYHTGQWSELYKVASSGSFNNIDDLISELSYAAACAGTLEAQGKDNADYENVVKELVDLNAWHRELHEVRR